MLRILVFHSDTENKGKYRQRVRAVLFSVCGRQGSLTELPEVELFTSAGQQKDLQWSSNAISNSVVPPKEHWRGVTQIWFKSLLCHPIKIMTSRSLSFPICEWR